MAEQTMGAYPVVVRIKREAARLIDTIHELAHGDKHCQALAMTAVEEGAMWAVKAATAPRP